MNTSNVDYRWRKFEKALGDGDEKGDEWWQLQQHMNTRTVDYI